MENDVTSNIGSTVTESTEINIAEIQSKEASLNDVLELLKSKNLSKEEHDRLWQEAYEKSLELLEYKIMMGQVILDTESASGQRSDLVGATCKVSKKDVYEALGLTKSQADDYQLLAKHPDSVTEAEKWASENKEVITTYRVLKFIKEKNLSVSNDSLSEQADLKTNNSETPDSSDDGNTQNPRVFIHIEVSVEDKEACIKYLQTDERIKIIRIEG